MSNGRIIRTKIHCYFLPERRVIQPAVGETNYQIFYSILAGLDIKEKQKLGLAGKTVSDFRSLNTRMQLEDEQEQKFSAWKSSLAILGITYQDVVQILAACMLLGNLEFDNLRDFSLEISSSEAELSKLCELLGLPEATLVTGLTMNTSLYKGERLSCPVDIQQVGADYSFTIENIYTERNFFLIR